MKMPKFVKVTLKGSVVIMVGMEKEDESGDEFRKEIEEYATKVVRDQLGISRINISTQIIDRNVKTRVDWVSDKYRIR